MSNGMPSNFVDDVFRDHAGFIWISTRGGGLLRYDGYSFLTLGIGGETAFRLRSNSCRNVAEDHYGRLWVAFDEGVQVIDLRAGQPETPKADGDLQKRLDAVLSEPCLRVYCDSRGCLWILKANRIDRIALDSDGNVKSILSAAHNTKVGDMAMADLDANGTLYVGLNFRLSRVSERGGRLRIENLSGGNPQLDGIIISAMAKWKGCRWFGTNRGLYCSGAGVRAWHSNGSADGLQHETVTSLAVTPDGQSLLVGTLAGVDIMGQDFRFHDHWNTASHSVRLASNFVNNILVSDGRVWIGTETGGITRLVPRQLALDSYTHDATDASSLSSGPVNSMYCSPTGDLWVGTVEGGLNMMGAAGGGFVHYTTANSGLSHNSVSALVPDDHGNLWIGTWGGGVSCAVQATASSRAGQKVSIIPLEADRAHRIDLLFVGALAFDPYNHGLWIGANAGLFFYDLIQRKITDPFPSCRSINGAIGSIVTRDGRLLMGCAPGMVSVDLKRGRDRNGHFSFRRYIYKLDRPGTKTFDRITCFYQGADGTLWIGSNGYGMYRVSRSRQGRLTVSNYATRDGLANNSVKGIVGGRHGMLWIATENGLSRFNPKTSSFSSFTVADGLVSNQFYFNGAAQGRHGEVYLGTDRGLMRLNGVDMASIAPGNLHFTGLYVGNAWAMAGSSYLDGSVVAAKKIHLHESDRNVRIEFSALNYGGEAQGVYSYRLRGYDDNWTKLPPGEHSVSYSSLPGGHYTFEVTYASQLGQTRLQTATMAVVVTPYFYKTWWFLLAVAAAIVALAAWLYNKRVEQVRNREAELLYRPIEAAIKDSPDPARLQERIQTILRNQERYRESQQRTVEQDRREVAQNREAEEPILTRAMAVLEKQYADPALNVQKLADAMGVSRSDLHKALKTEAGIGTTQFIRDYRLDVARRLLDDNVAERNVTEIAYRVGFNDPKYFTRCFTQRFGVAPSAYRKDEA